MFDIKQFTTEESCLNCRGCCRFTQDKSVWQPCLLEEEAQIFYKQPNLKALVSPSKRIKSKQFEGGFICSFLDYASNKCNIYDKRPFECRIYPFIINKKDNQILLSVDTKCPFIEKKKGSKEYNEYVDYLIGFLNAPVIKASLRNNSHLYAQYYDNCLTTLSVLAL